MDLLERESHLAQLHEHLQEVRQGHGRVVMVGGEAGVGKTSLMQQFQATLLGQVPVFHASCDALSTPAPVGPARDLAPALGVAVGSYHDEQGRDALFRAVHAVLANRATPLVLIGEDAHWADSVSLEFVRFMARRIGEMPCLFLLTYRDDELGAEHPLRLTLGDLATTRTVHRIHLDPLSLAAVQELAQPAQRDAAQLHQLTGGNPFFVTEVLAAGDERVPGTVSDAVLARASRLTPEARAVLDIAAVIGGRIDPELVLAVAGPVSDDLDRCIVSGLLHLERDRLRFRHELVRVAILEAIPPLRRRLLHGRVLRMVRDGSVASRDLAVLAHHAEAAGDREAVLAFAGQAAEQAAALHAHREAAAQYARALRFGDDLPPQDRATLLEAHALANYLCDQGDTAITSRREAILLRRALGDHLREGDDLRWLSRHYWYQGQGAEAEAAAMDAVRLLETLPPGRELAMAYSTVAQLRMLADDDTEAMAWGERALAQAEAVGDVETAIHALCTIGTSRRDHDDARGTQELEQSLRLAIEQRFPDHAGRALSNLAWGATTQMALPLARERIAAGLAYTTEHDLQGYRVYLLSMQAMVRLHSGEWAEGMADAHEVWRGPERSPLARIVALTALGRMHARRGEAAAAAAVLDDALALAQPTGQLLRLGPVTMARAEAALLADRPDEARRELLAIAPLVQERGWPWLRSECAWLLWQCGEREASSADVMPPVAMQFAGDWAGAAAAWRALGCPYDAALAQLQADDVEAVRQGAATLTALGANAALALGSERLRRYGVRDQAVRRGPRPSTQAHPAGLTQREAEILALLGEGLRNAQIAERLYLTPKTVSHHLSAIYAKLGVSNRLEAAQAAQQRGISSPPI